MRQVEDRGYALLAGAGELDLTPSALQADGVGDRIMLRHAWCRDAAAALRARLTAAGWLPPDAIAVQCTLFAKDPERNWLVALHQDLSLPVRERRDAAGWSGWSEKDGVMFAQPPVTVLERVLGVRLHLDPCDADDGALCVVPGSHRHGRLDPAAAAALRERSGEEPCVAAAGDVLLLRPLLLHRSPKSTSARPRRVLHFVFGPGTLPDGMVWPEPSTVNDR